MAKKAAKRKEKKQQKHASRTAAAEPKPKPKTHVAVEDDDSGDDSDDGDDSSDGDNDVEEVATSGKKARNLWAFFTTRKEAAKGDGKLYCKRCR